MPLANYTNPFIRHVAASVLAIRENYCDFELGTMLEVYSRSEWKRAISQHADIDVSDDVVARVVEDLRCIVK